MKLKDKVCVVTGGAMGNGLGIVKVFLKYGAKVSIIDYDKSVNDVVINLKNDGYNVIGFCADIRDKVSVDEAIKKTMEVFGNIDVLVNNAGVRHFGRCRHRRPGGPPLRPASLTAPGRERHHPRQPRLLQHRSRGRSLPQNVTRSKEPDGLCRIRPFTTRSSPSTTATPTTSTP